MGLNDLQLARKKETKESKDHAINDLNEKKKRNIVSRHMTFDNSHISSLRYRLRKT